MTIDLGKTHDAIEKASNDYAAKHQRLPRAITLRADVDEALHRSVLAFLYDFVDMEMTRERFMGMDVTVSTELAGPEFVIEGAP